MKNIAIIGAGLSGMTSAHMLKNHAHVTLFEKMPYAGGRIVTRGSEPYYFDCGPQFFKAKIDNFKAFIAPMLEQGIIERWDARFAEITDRHVTHKRQWDAHYAHYVGAPSMQAIPAYLRQGLDIRPGVCVQSVTRENGTWCLADDHSTKHTGYDWVISTVPATQALDFLPPALSFLPQVASVAMKGCFSLMLGFEKPLPLDFDAALVRGEDISWISVNSAKPGRSDAFCLLVHSSNKWADKHMDDDHDTVMEYLCDQASGVTGHDMGKADHKALYVSQFANIEKQKGPTHFIDADHKIAMCGDWCIQGRMEAAFVSGFDVSHALLESMTVEQSND